MRYKADFHDKFEFHVFKSSQRRAVFATQEKEQNKTQQWSLERLVPEKIAIKFVLLKILNMNGC